MEKEKRVFEIEHLDHVAIRVANFETSIEWYVDRLGLKVYQLEKWGDYPVFLLAGKSGIALFPENTPGHIEPESKRSSIDHFAFHVSTPEFAKAKNYFNSINQDFKEQDHYYFKSIYLKDPDNHTVELTCLTVPAEEFYK